MRLLDGRTALVFGVANDHSIAWGVARALHDEGAEVGFSSVESLIERRVRPLADSIGSTFVEPCDVQSDEQIRTVFARWAESHESLDILVHALAFARREDLEGSFVDTSRDGFALALDVSAYSLVALVREARPLLRRGSSVLTLSYYGAEKVVANYNVMGVAKAALEASVRYLAADLGPDGIRVNAISAGPSGHWRHQGSPDSSGCMATSPRSRRCARTSRPRMSAGVPSTSRRICPARSRGRRSTWTAASTSWACRPAIDRRLSLRSRRIRRRSTGGSGRPRTRGSGAANERSRWFRSPEAPRCFRTIDNEGGRVRRRATRGTPHGRWRRGCGAPVPIPRERRAFDIRSTGSSSDQPRGNARSARLRSRARWSGTARRRASVAGVSNAIRWHAAGREHPTSPRDGLLRMNR